MQAMLLFFLEKLLGLSNKKYPNCKEYHKPDFYKNAYEAIWHFADSTAQGKVLLGTKNGILRTPNLQVIPD